MPRLDPEAAVNPAVYSADLIRRIIAVAATRYIAELRTPAAWGDLFRQELANLK